MSEHAAQPIATPHFLKSARDVVPTWSQKQMDNFRKWGLNCLSVTYQKETTKSVPIVDIPSTFRTHSSQPCSFHDSICGHDENAAGSCVVPRIPSNVQLWLTFLLQLLLLPLGGSRRILQTGQRISSKHVQNVASQPSSHLCQS